MAATSSAAHVAGYELVRDLPVKRVRGRYTELIHRRSGLRHIHVAYSAPSSACFILVRTRAEDDTGAAHVLEHMCFQGSQRFGPVALKDLADRCLASHATASTRHDYTMYNFSSRHRQGFLDVLKVYLDAVFHPRLDDEAFWQEGWRYELGDDDTLSLTGRVYNEVQGLAGNDFFNLWEAVGRGLYPGTPFSHDAGGNPRALQDLTPDGARDFHRRYYYPANALVLTAGVIPLDDVLRLIDASGINEVSSQDPAPAIAGIREPRPARVDIATAANDPAAGQGAVAWAAPCQATDPFGFRAAALLADVLAGTPDAPLRRTLAAAGLGSAPADAPRFLDGYPNPAVLAGVKGVTAAEGLRLEEVLLEAIDGLSRLVPADHLERALDNMEADLHDRGETSYLGLVNWPFYLRMVMPACKAAIDGGDAYRFIDWETELTTLRRHAGQRGYYEDLVRAWLGQNPHSAWVRLNPEPQRAEEAGNADHDRMRESRAHLSPNARTEIRTQADRVARRQQMRAAGPALPVAQPRDLPEEALPEPCAMAATCGSTVHVYPSESTGLVHVGLRADATGLDAESCDLLPLLASLLARQVGHGFDGAVDVVQRADGSPTVWLTLSGKALARRSDHVMADLASSVAELEFSPALVADGVAQLRAEWEKLLVYTWSAPRLALSLAAAGLNDACALRERMRGVSQLALLRQLNVETAAVRLKTVAGAVFGRGRVHGFGTAGETSAQRLARQLTSLAAALPEAPPSLATPVPGLRNSYPGSGEARTTPAPHAFNGLAYQAVSFAHPDAAALAVATAVMSSSAAVQAISRERGAYGAAAAYDHYHGLVEFSSWYDPHVLATFGSFQTAVRSAVEGQLDRGQLSVAAGQLLARHDATLSSDELARRDWDDLMRDISRDARSAFREAVLAATPSDVQRALSAHLGSSRHGTIGSADVIRKAESDSPGLFSRVLPA